ncbi:MAG: hypothetical protein Q9209_007667 [Squamulea sp. 1 TL-2023]
MASSATPPGTPPLPPELSSASSSENLPEPSTTHLPQLQPSEHLKPSFPPPSELISAAKGGRSKETQANVERYPKQLLPGTFNKVFNRYLFRSHNHIHHLNRLLITTPSLDLILSTTSYTLSLLSALLVSSPSSPNSPLTHLSPLRTSLANLSSLLSETRITLRLFGLLSIYTWAHSEYTKYTTSLSEPSHFPPPDILIQTITFTQILAGFSFQLLENLAYLGDKAILPLSAKTRSKYWLWCCRAWAVHVFLELAKLYRQRYLDNPVPKILDAKHQLESKTQNSSDRTRYRRHIAGYSEENATWWRQLKINLAYAPMTLHYSLEDGLLSNTMVALCGVLASSWSLGAAWRKTAE